MHARGDLVKRLTEPRIFVPVRGGNPAYGYEATALMDLCELIWRAKDGGVLTPRLADYAEQAQTVIRAFAKVGIIAVIDEVTGYQNQRQHDELQNFLAMYVLPEHRPYISKIPPEFTRELYRVYGWDTSSQRGPRYAGKLTRKLIYEQLPPVVLPKLDELNPSNSKYQRKKKHFSYLTEKVGLQHFRTQLAGVMALLRRPQISEYFRCCSERSYGKQMSLPNQDLDEYGE